MVKFFLFPLALMAVSLSRPISSTSKVHRDVSSYRSKLITEVNERGNFTVTGINPNYLADDIRIYQFDDNPIDEIADSAFSGTSFTSVTISKDITRINNAVFENATNIKNIQFTGSKEEFQTLNLSFDIQKVSFYAVDEGFIYYWNTQIRPEENTNICNITRDQFSYVYGLYKNLVKADLDFVDAYQDLAGAKISDSMKELITIFSENSSQNKKDEWNQTGAITLIIVIAVIGMTSITVFFLLKTKNIIH